MSESTHPSLLVRLRDGQDEEAWRDFCSRYRNLFLRYAEARGLQPTDCEDVVQIALISLSRALRGFEYDPSRGRFRNYLGRVAANTVNAYQAASARRPFPLSDALLESVAEVGGEPMSTAAGTSEADALWEQEWMRHHYELALSTVRKKFDPRSVEVFEQLLSGASVAELATRYDMTSQAIHKVKQGIRDRLRRLIVDQIHREETYEAHG